MMPSPNRWPAKYNGGMPSSDTAPSGLIYYRTDRGHGCLVGVWNTHYGCMTVETATRRGLITDEHRPGDPGAICMANHSV